MLFIKPCFCALTALMFFVSLSGCGQPAPQTPVPASASSPAIGTWKNKSGNITLILKRDGTGDYIFGPVVADNASNPVVWTEKKGDLLLHVRYSDSPETDKNATLSSDKKSLIITKSTSRPFVLFTEVLSMRMVFQRQ